jgi:hypothetical protein
VRPAPRRYLLLDIGEGCQPANRVYIADLQQLRKGGDGAPDFAAYDFFSGTDALPLTKLIDNFEVGPLGAWEGGGRDCIAARACLAWQRGAAAACLGPGLHPPTPLPALHLAARTQCRTSQAAKAAALASPRPALLCCCSAWPSSPSPCRRPPNPQAQFNCVANEGSTFYLMTNLDAPRYR